MDASLATADRRFAPVHYVCDRRLMRRGPGHTLTVYFPTDGPGPAVIAYIGQLVIDVDPDGVWTLVRNTGKEVDVCALLE